MTCCKSLWGTRLGSTGQGYTMTGAGPALELISSRPVTAPVGGVGRSRLSPIPSLHYRVDLFARAASSPIPDLMNSRTDTDRLLNIFSKESS